MRRIAFGTEELPQQAGHRSHNPCEITSPKGAEAVLSFRSDVRVARIEGRTHTRKYEEGGEVRLVQRPSPYAISSALNWNTCWRARGSKLPLCTAISTVPLSPITPLR